MKSADEFQKISDALYFWQVYEPELKAEMTCCALVTPQGLVFVDPIPLEKAALEELLEVSQPGAIVLTNGNHERAAGRFQERFGIPIFASAEAGIKLPQQSCLADGDFLFDSIRVIALPGFGPGEIALFSEASPATLIIGDAIVHFGSSEFCLLPEKYCLDLKLGLKSLRKLLELDFETMTFAHGLPLLRGAKKRLEKIL
jgi:hypothetical protein